MRFLKRRMIQPRFYDAQAEKPRVIATHRVKRCGTCTYQVPEADITIEDGAEHCPMCVDTYTAQYLADEQKYVADVQSEAYRKLQHPTQFSIRALDEPNVGAITSITDSAGNLVTQAAPLRLVRNVATVLKLNGQNFTSAMTMTYPSGISDSAAPVITSTLITLTLLASVGMTTGAYSLTVNDGQSTYGHIYKNILSVR